MIGPITRSAVVALCLMGCGATNPVTTGGGSASSAATAADQTGASASDQGAAASASGAEAPSGDAANLATPIADAYRSVAGQIIAEALADRQAYERLTFLTDRIGHRLSGSKALERSVAWAVQMAEQDGHDNVRTEKVMVPHWVRGAESAEIVAPATHELVILGLGNTVGTGRQGVTGDILVVDTFEQLEAAGAAVRDKIVLFNKKMLPFTEERGTGYGEASPYRVRGPSRAAKLGAKAVLVRSLTARSLRSPHTGTLVYDPEAPQIPAAAVTTEDADLIARLVAAGETVKVRLTLGARMLPDAESANVIAELRGRETPDQIVLIGAHLDSWDVGQGAHDDATGCVITMQALTVLRRLGLRPRRTIRLVLFTNEENGLRGGIAYAKQHSAEIADHVMALESDSGSFAPRGFRLTGTPKAMAQLRDIITLLAPIGATNVMDRGGGADLIPLMRAGVQALGHWVDSSTYFDIHHTHADTLDKVDPTHLVQNVAAVAVVAYVIADMPERFGGNPQAAASAPADRASAEKTPASSAPADRASAEKTPASSAPADRASAEKTPASSAPADRASAEKTPAGSGPRGQ